MLGGLSLQLEGAGVLLLLEEEDGGFLLLLEEDEGGLLGTPLPFLGTQ